MDEFGQTFVIRLVIRLYCKDGHKTYYPSRRTRLLCDLNDRLWPVRKNCAQGLEYGPRPQAENSGGLEYGPRPQAETSGKPFENPRKPFDVLQRSRSKLNEFNLTSPGER